MFGTKTVRAGLAAALIAGAGCGGGAPPVTSSMDEATVTGTVTVRGKPATAGEISFDPTNIERKVVPRTAKIGPDGKYTVKTLIGENSVTVRGKQIDKDPVLSANRRVVDVKPGESVVPIELP